MMSKDNEKKWFETLADALLREPKDREQLIDILRDATERELIDPDSLEMIEGVLKVSEMQVRDVMIPRPKMTVINEDATAAEAYPIITQSGHSRFPIIADTRDEITGILLAKDLLKMMHKPSTSNQAKTIKSISRKATFIPESKRLDVLLKEFRLQRYHMAIIVDEYGGVAGLVTIEDVLEQIVGNIEDEYDVVEHEANITSTADNIYQIKALTPIEEFNEFFNCNHSDEDCDTFGGLVLKSLTHIPKQGETCQIDDLTITVVKTRSRCIELLEVQRDPHKE